MATFLFTLLVVLLGAGVGLSGLLAWMHFRLNNYALALTKLGFGITNGVLLYAVGLAGTAQTSWRTWFYLMGLSILTVGLGLQTRDLIIMTAKHDVRGE